jgi:hypothetical protein
MVLGIVHGQLDELERRRAESLGRHLNTQNSARS